MTEAEQAALIKAALTAAVAPAPVYEYDAVPGQNGVAGVTPSTYLLIDLTRRYVDSHRGSGEASVTGGRLGTRYVAKLTTNARAMRAKVTAAIEDQILTDGTHEVGPFAFESSDAIQPDDGYQSGADVWTF